MNKKKNFMLEQGIMLTIIAMIAAIVSLAKESIFAKYFGVSIVSDAYTIAIQVPEMLFAIVWETISAVVIPLYTEKLYKEGKSGAQKFFSNILTVVCLLSCCFIFCGELFSDYIIGFLFPGVSEQTHDLAVELLRWIFPVLFFEGIIRVITGILNVHNQFVIPRILSSIRNIGVIAFLILFTNKFGIYAAIFGLLTGIIIECILCMLANNKYERYIPTIDIKEPALKKVVVMAAPLLLGIGARELNQITDKVIASFFNTGSISSLNYASKLSSMIEVALLGNIALLLYPRYSELAAEGKKKELVDEYIKTVNVCLLLSIPIILGGVFLRQEIVSIAFEGGEFDKASVVIVSNLFAVYLVSAMFTTINGASVKLFTACCDTKTPTINAVIGVGVNVILNVILSYYFGVVGLTVATLIASIVTCVRLFLVVRKKILGFCLRPIIIVLVKSLISGAMMYIGLLILKFIILECIKTSDFTGKLLYCLVSVVMGACIYGISLFLVKVKEITSVVKIFKVR